MIDDVCEGPNMGEDEEAIGIREVSVVISVVVVTLISSETENIRQIIQSQCIFLLRDCICIICVFCKLRCKLTCIA